MAVSQRRHLVVTLLHYITTTFFCIVAGPPMVACMFILMILTIPYTLYYWSSNCGIRTHDMPIIQLYLDHFETLHPELATALKRAFEAYQPTEEEVPSSHWPQSQEQSGGKVADVEKGMDRSYITMNGRKFTLAAGLFMRLEKAGFPRQLLMEHLMHDVETEIKMDEQERDEYRRVMYKLCAHRTSDLWDTLLPWGTTKHMTNGEGFLTPGKSPTGITPYLLRNDQRMDWVLQERAILVPMDGDTYKKAEKLANFGLWRPVRNDVDMDTAARDACWQLVDLR